MGSDLNPSVLMRKAIRACASARALLDLNDVDGACSRAYYAMFDAARAALLAADHPDSQATAKTHSGLIAAFGSSLVKSGLVDKAYGRMLKRAEEVVHI